MADTRCANPELQLDVDMMMLEYALFHTTRAHLEALSDECPKPYRTEEASRLLAIFDTLIRLFNLNHAGYVKSDELCLGLKLLEFLVLLSSITLEEDDDHTFSTAHRQALRTDGLQALRSRRAWLAARNAQLISSQGNLSLDLDVEEQIYQAWTRNFSRPTYDISAPNFKPGLFHLMPRFMNISGEIMATVRQDPNEKWTDIAGEFMLQASLESLRLQIPVAQNASTTATGGEGGPRHPRLEECFAWGYVPDLPGDDSWLINDLFRLHPYPEENDEGRAANDVTTTVPAVETPLWTDTRARFLSEFHIDNAASASSQTCRLERLEAKYPPPRFLQTLVSFLRQIWDMVCNDEMMGTPLLVQIEEGHLKSLGVEGSAFDDFLVRVGLKADHGGLLKLKL